MTDPSLTIEEEAAGWVVRMNSDQLTRADLEGFQAWLNLGEAQQRAYAEHAAVWRGFGCLADDEQARAILMPRRGGRRRPQFMAARRAMLGGLGALAAAGVAAAVLAPALNVQTFRTQMGEQRRVALADGSTILLNTDTVVRVKLRARERRLFLDRGQAFFQVAKDRTRPFRVFVSDSEVRALGTAFDVRKLGNSARVTLEEGKLGIYRSWPGSPSEPQRPVAVLTQGQQVVLAPVAAPVIHTADLRQSEAWRAGRLILADSSLADAAAELNRYGGPRIILADPATAGVRISGVFRTSDRKGFIEAVTAALPVVVTRQDDDEIVLARRS